MIKDNPILTNNKSKIGKYSLIKKFIYFKKDTMPFYE
jgi:hypothetical protein